MAREHARVKLSIWEDDDYRDLSVEAQHLYQVLMIHPQLTYAGVTDWRPGKLSGFARGWTAEDVELAAKELSERRYIIIDEHTEEVLIRSFIRNDELLDSPNMAVAVRKAHMSISSKTLRGVVVFELARLHTDRPELKGWPNVKQLLTKGSVNPSEIPSFNPSVKVSVNPSVKGSGAGTPIPSGNPSATPSVTPSATTAPAPAPSYNNQNLGSDKPSQSAATRPRDLMFDALVEVCRLNPDQITKSAGGEIGKAKKDLIAVGATPEMVRARSQAWQQRYPNMTLTPSALAKHWASLDVPIAPKSVLKSWQR